MNLPLVSRGGGEGKKSKSQFSLKVWGQQTTNSLNIQTYKQCIPYHGILLSNKKDQATDMYSDHRGESENSMLRKTTHRYTSVA
jgi:hypothetical protein